MPFINAFKPYKYKSPYRLCLPSLFSLGVQELAEINSSEFEVNFCNLLYTDTQTSQIQAIPKLGMVWLKKFVYNITYTKGPGSSFKIISHYIKLYA